MCPFRRRVGFGSRWEVATQTPRRSRGSLVEPYPVGALEKLTDKLFTNRYLEDTGHPHIEIANQDVCRDKCSGKYCNFFCPAGVYEWDEEKRETVVSFGNCVECGACSIGCPYDNIICFTPRGGFGVQFRNG
jgi:ferredoxin like protein